MEQRPASRARCLMFQKGTETMANPWYAFYPGDYGRDTAHLSLMEDGAYRRLIDHYYVNARPLLGDFGQLFRICRAFTRSEKDAVRSVLGQFFVIDGDFFRHNRIDRELTKQADYKARLSEGARKTNLKRWGQLPSDSPSDSPAESPTDRKPQPQSRVIQKTSSEQQDRSDERSSEQRKKTANEPSEQAFGLAALLKTEIRGNKPDYRLTPQQERKWAVTADRMLRLDGRKYEEIKDVICWAQHDQFWMANVLSMGTLREKFDQLQLKSAGSSGHGPNDRQFISVQLEIAPCPLDICDGSGWWIERGTRRHVGCECRPRPPVAAVAGCAS